MVAPKETKLWVLSKLPIHDDGQFRAIFSKMRLTQQTKTGKLKEMSQTHREEEQRASPTPFIRMESPSFSLWHLWTQSEKEKLIIMEKGRKILCSISGGMGWWHGMWMEGDGGCVLYAVQPQRRPRRRLTFKGMVREHGTHRAMSCAAYSWLYSKIRVAKVRNKRLVISNEWLCRQVGDLGK